MKIFIFFSAVNISLMVLLNGCSRFRNQQNPMEQDANLQVLKKEIPEDLTGNLLPYWYNKMPDSTNGGFFGRVDSHEKVHPEADKGGILNARILWTFSSAYRVTRNPLYLGVADRAKDYIMAHFIDKKYGGAFMTVKSTGEPGDTRKQILTESYFIYALAEYYRATGDREALAESIRIFELVEQYARDPEMNGYFEVYTRDWKRSPDLLLGENSARDEKTMITHLHLVEAYSGLYRVWPDKKMEESLRNILTVFNDKVVDKETHHLIYFLDRDWQATTEIDSYGHDIEGSWLIVEAAGLLKDPALEESVRKLSLKMADAAAEGLQEDGSLLTEKDRSTGKFVLERSWWEQAESVIGYLNAYKISGDKSYLDKSVKSWDYIKKNFIDYTHGGWYRLVGEDGEPADGDRANFWTCPYHNGRMCMEVMERIPEP